MANAAKVALMREIVLKPNDKDLHFKWQMFFNAYWVEELEFGVVARFAYLNQGTAAEIVCVFVSSDGLRNLQKTTEKYITHFANVTPYEPPTMPAVRQFSPLFANHIRAAYSGNCAEISFHTVPMTSIASTARGDMKAADVSTVPVALLHSSYTLHQQLVMDLLAFAK